MDYRVTDASILANASAEELTMVLILENEDGVELSHPLFLSDNFIRNTFKKKGLNVDEFQPFHIVDLMQSATLKGNIQQKTKGESFKVLAEGVSIHDDKGNRRLSAKADVGKTFKVYADGVWIDFSERFSINVPIEVRDKVRASALKELLQKAELQAKLAQART